MNRGWARTLALTSLLPLLGSLGCDALTARSFAGTVMQLTIDGVTAQSIPAGQHLELWARTQYDDIVRVDGYYNLAAGKTAYGLAIRQAISLSDPCMIDGYYYLNNSGGNLLTSAAAYPTSISAGGVTQTPDEQAQAVVKRIEQLTTAGTTGPLLAILPYATADDPVLPTPPAIPDATSPSDRRTICEAYTTSPHDLAYVANPYQITAPLKGAVYGFVKYVSVTPPANYDGFRIDSPINLKGVQEIFMTVEGTTVDPKNRGPLFLVSTLTQNGAGVVHFDLRSPDPNGQATGTAALLVDLDQDPVQF
ncbi:MAG: hypothetical protein JWM53_3968 [bacterium]|nr:hypothetical protein [bacterium]